MRGSWRGRGGPPGIEENAVAYWRNLCRAAIKTPAWQDALARNGWTDMHTDGDELAAYLSAE